jgi:hypothetical protein
VPLPFYTFDHPGGSAAWSSAHDLIRFGLFHMGHGLPEQHGVLSDEGRNRMQRMEVVQRYSVGYGLGWRIHEDDGGYRAIFHGGSMGGVSTHLRLVPAEGTAVVALTNGNCRWHDDLVNEVLAALLPGYAQDGEEKPAAVAPWPAAELLGTWSGTIATQNGRLPLTLGVQPDGDVHARLAQQPPTLLSELRYRGGRLTGVLAGDLGTADSAGHNQLELDLQLRGERLDGSITATWPTWRHTSRPRNATSYWVQLRHQP